MAQISLGSNIASLKALDRLDQAGAKVSSTYERLATGLRITRASDDAASLSISSDLSVSSRVYTQGIRNVNDAISLHNIAEGATVELTNIVTRIKELATQASNGVFTDTQRGALDKEGQALRSEYNRIVSSTSFNGQQLLDGSSSSLSIQFSFGTSGALSLDINTALNRPAPDGTFTAVLTSTGTGTFKNLTTGDVNGDGKDDIAEIAGARADIFISNGDGSFLAPVSYTVIFSSVIRAVELADLNNDSVLDLVAGGDSGVSVRLGVGDGTFGAQLRTTVTGGQTANVTVADVNNDGFLDLVGPDSNSGTDFYVMIGNGNGTFSAATTLTASGSGGAVEFADFNSDGNLDFVLRQNSIISISMGNGNGTFSAYRTLTATASQLGNLVAGDVNGDGVLDFLNPSGTTRAWLGNGDGTFRYSSGGITGSGNLTWGTLKDVNEDGILDLVASTASSLDTFIGNGDGTFGAARSIAVAGGFDKAVLGDFRGVGVWDAVGSLTGQNDLSILLGNYSTTTTLRSFSLQTREDALDAQGIMSAAFERLAGEKVRLGANRNRLDAIVGTQSVAIENIEAANSRIRDADVAEETAGLLQQQIVQRAAQAVLAQANSQSGIVLQLLKV